MYKPKVASCRSPLSRLDGNTPVSLIEFLIKFLINDVTYHLILNRNRQERKLLREILHVVY